MIPWIAVDTIGGRAIRLREGRLEARTDYGPVADAVNRWVAAGARHLHLVDLGAAFGRPETLAATVQAAHCAFPDVVLQVAGGVRAADQAMRLADSGAARVVVGSLLFQNPAEVRRILRALGPDRCIAALDVREGSVRVAGWTEDSGAGLPEACSLAAELGFEEALITDIARDGLLGGPNLELYASLESARLRVIASGGITSRSHLETLAAIPGVSGAVIGKALYEGRLAAEDVLEFGP